MGDRKSPLSSFPIHHAVGTWQGTRQCCPRCRKIVLTVYETRAGACEYPSIEAKIRESDLLEGQETVYCGRFPLQGRRDVAVEVERGR